MIDKSKLNEAFKLMRNRGLLARQNFSCCGNCGGYELATLVSAMPKEKRAKVNGCVFYHRQETERLRKGGDLYLAYGPLDTTLHGTIGLPTAEVGQLAASALVEAGLTVEWDGKPETKICVKA